MLNKKINFVLLFLFSAITQCMELNVFTSSTILKKKAILEQLRDAVTITQLRCKRSLLKNEIEYRHLLIEGYHSAATEFFYAIDNAKNKNDFDKALMAKGEFYIQLYRTERINRSSVLGIIASNNALPLPQKKAIIHDLLNIYHFIPTERDNSFRFLELWERSHDKARLFYHAIRRMTRNDRKKLKVKLSFTPIKLIIASLLLLEEPLF